MALKKGKKSALKSSGRSISGKKDAKDWFLQYPVMSTLRPAYPLGPWHYKVAQLVKVNLNDVRLKGAWAGLAELFMVPHIGCPVAALPVVRVAEGRQHLWNMTLKDGEVVHDYLEAGQD